MRTARQLYFAIATTAAVVTAPVLAENYVIDTNLAHAFIQFKIKHLGYSWLMGRFDQFSGTFSYDEKNLAASTATVHIKTASVDTNHAERDGHLRDTRFLNSDKYPEAVFVGTGFTSTGKGKGVLAGNFTLHGVTRPLTIDVTHIGAGPDPWGNYRSGFEGSTRFALKDFGIDYDLGPASREVEIYLSIEGIRQ